MGERRADAQRTEIRAAVDTRPVKAVDTYLCEHPDAARDDVVEEALLLWYAREQERAIEAQFTAPQSGVERADRAAWKRLQRAAAARLFR